MSRSPLWQRCNIPVPIITRAQCHHLPYPHTGVPDVLLFRTQCSSSFYVGHSDCVWDSGTSGCPDCNQCCYFVDFFPVQTQCLNIWKNYVMLLLSPKTLSGRSLQPPIWCFHSSFSLHWDNGSYILIGWRSPPCSSTVHMEFRNREEAAILKGLNEASKKPSPPIAVLRKEEHIRPQGPHPAGRGHPPAT